MEAPSVEFAFFLVFVVFPIATVVLIALGIRAVRKHQDTVYKNDYRRKQRLQDEVRREKGW